MVTLLRRLSLFVFLVGFCCGSAARAETPELFPLDQVQPGLRGKAYTIFAGPEIESFDLEVLGVMRNFIGPKQDIILVRLLGDKPNYTGVVAGMSGSPVYFEGKLAGAISLRFGAFTREPIAGVTPIQNMLRAVQPGEAGPARAAELGAEVGELPAAPVRYPLPAEAASAVGLRSATDTYLLPIETPLTFVGFDPRVISRFSDQLTQFGFVGVQGGGTAGPGAPATLAPGGAVAATLVSGDMTIGGICTISYLQADQLYACGHWILGLGSVEMPMARAEIVTTVASQFASFKIGNIGEVIGAFREDRRSAIVGRLGAAPRMVPVELTLVRGAQTWRYHYEIMQHPKISPLLMDFTVFNGLYSVVESGEGMTYRITGRLLLQDHAAVALDDMFSPTDAFIPDAFSVVLNVGTAFRRIFGNPFETPNIERVELKVEMLPERRSATIENAWCDKSEASPGETVRVKVVLRPYRGERIVREIPIIIPPQAAKGDLRILVSDATLLNRLTSSMLLGPIFPGGGFNPRLTSLDQLIALLNRERRSDRVYLSVFQRTPTMLIEDKILPSVPLSQMNVLNNQSNATRPGSTWLFSDSIVSETSEPLDQVISGSHWLGLTVR